MISGDYYFEDNLKYEFDNWKYCTGDDRRLNIYHKAINFKIDFIKRLRMV